MKRRRFLRRTGAIGGLAVAGCLGAPAGQTPTQTKSPTPSDGCDGFRPHPVDLSTYSFSAYGEGFELTASTGQIPMGDEISFALRNTTNSEQATGNENLYAVQRATPSGWEHVLWAPENWAWTEEALVHGPGEAFEWTFPFTASGLSTDPYQVCTDLVPGVYRFVYWGLTGGRRALAVVFTAGLAAEPLVIEDFETTVFDHADIGMPIVEGGIDFDLDPMASRHLVDVFDTAAALDRFHLDRLESIDSESAVFVRDTDPDESYLVAFQAFPASSHPDYRVERIERITNDVHLRVTDESEGGTADITVETLLVRIPRNGDSAPRHATVTTEEGRTYSTV